MINSITDTANIVNLLPLFATNPDSYFYFITFTEGSDGESKASPKRYFVKATDELPPEMLKQNEYRRGLHFCPNTTLIKPTKFSAQSIQGFNALFVDIDRNPKTDDEYLNSKSPPNLITTTPRGKHLFWLVEPNEIENAEHYEACQKTLIFRYQGDAGILKPNHTIRYPSSYHHKGEIPYHCKYNIYSRDRYTLSELELGVRKERFEIEEAPKIHSLDYFLDSIEESPEGQRNTVITRMCFILGKSLAQKTLKDEVTLSEIEDNYLCPLFDSMRLDGKDIETGLKSLNAGYEKGLNEPYPEKEYRMPRNSDDAPRTPKTILEAVERYSQDLTSLDLGFDELSRQVTLKGKPIYVDDAWLSICREANVNLPKDMSIDTIIEVAKLRPTNPIKEYLDNLPIATSFEWLLELLEKITPFKYESDKDPCNMFFAYYLAGAVARVYHPGIDFPYVLVLQGEQGIGKDWLIRELFTENLKYSYNHELNEKENLICAYTSWICLIPEMDTILAKKEIGAIKNLVTQTYDRYRELYCRSSLTRMRHFVMAATINPEQFLNDPTGTRRFLVIRSGQAEHTTMNVPYVIQNRDRIWSEAKLLYQTLTHKPDGTFINSIFLPTELRIAQREINIDCLHLGALMKEFTGAIKNLPLPYAVPEREITRRLLPESILDPSFQRKITEIKAALKAAGYTSKVMKYFGFNTTCITHKTNETLKPIQLTEDELCLSINSWANKIQQVVFGFYVPVNLPLFLTDKQKIVSDKRKTERKLKAV